MMWHSITYYVGVFSNATAIVVLNSTRMQDKCMVLNIGTRFVLVYCITTEFSQYIFLEKGRSLVPEKSTYVRFIPFRKGHCCSYTISHVHCMESLH